MSNVIPGSAVRSRRALLGLVLAALPLLALGPAFGHGDQQVPFKATFDTTFQSVLDFPLLHVTVSGQGNASHLGNTTAVSNDELVNLLSGAGTATFVLTGANGDTVTISTSFQVTQVAGGVTFAGTYTVTGGTGRFDGATGSGAASGSAIFTGPTDGVGSFALDGTISSPGKS